MSFAAHPQYQPVAAPYKPYGEVTHPTERRFSPYDGSRLSPFPVQQTADLCTQTTEALFFPFLRMALQLSLPILVNLKVTIFNRGTSLGSISSPIASVFAYPHLSRRNRLIDLSLQVAVAIQGFMADGNALLKNLKMRLDVWLHISSLVVTYRLMRI